MPLFAKPCLITTWTPRKHSTERLLSREQGRFGEAELLYRDLLRERPETPEALEGLGVIAFQQGMVDEAASLFGRWPFGPIHHVSTPIWARLSGSSNGPTGLSIISAEG